MRRIKIVDILQATFGRISTTSLMGYSEDRDIADLGGRDFVSKDMVAGAIASNAVVITAPPQADFIYTLSPSEVTSVNALGKWPNFVGLVGGVPFPEIKPRQYVGAPGGFSSITVDLNTDSGNTVLQFS